MSIPPPSHVAQVWLTESGLSVHFPQANDGRGHTIFLPGDVYGLQCMMTILRERQAEGPYTVGHASTPTQWQIERDIKRLRGDEAVPKLELRKLTKDDREVFRRAAEIERRKAARAAEAAKMLEELGI